VCRRRQSAEQQSEDQGWEYQIKKRRDWEAMYANLRDVQRLMQAVK
jgi:division protein CdvB (Snf7/Vps24/ESCRT-III family)